MRAPEGQRRKGRQASYGAANHCFGVPTSSHEAEGHTAGGVSASRPVDPARSENLGMYGVLMRENREIPLLARPVDRWAGRPGNVEAVSLG